MVRAIADAGSACQWCTKRRYRSKFRALVTHVTPAARVAAAIGVLDQILQGLPAEQALTNWGRASRFAGSGDRAALRDLVFSALRCRRSFAVLGGSDSGRGLMIGGLRAAATDPAGIFTGVGHAPSAMIGADLVAGVPEGLSALDCPDWLAPLLQASLSADFAPVMQLLQQRAPAFVRVNLARCSPEEAVEALAEEGILAVPHPLAATALELHDGARKLHGSRSYAEGLVDLQDAASQAVVADLPVAKGARVLDYCAGGGGKALALADRGATVFAHDHDPRRMRDLPVRAERAGVRIVLLEGAGVARAAPFDLVLLDVPCSGSGSWRRSPEAKWALTPARLAELVALQAEILDQTCDLVGAKGQLGYVTCSLLDAENATQIERFLARNPGWKRLKQRKLTPVDGGDGFFVSLLARE